jgi:hypothetical protein
MEKLNVFVIKHQTHIFIATILAFIVIGVKVFKK